MSELAKSCSVEDCDRPLSARGYCNRHYHRLLRHGDPLGGTAGTGEPAAFLKLASEFERDECLIWPYAKSGAGYGVVRLAGKAELVHKLVCATRHGPKPTPRHEAAHGCGNPACCSPQHLRWATPSENQLDKRKHGTDNRGAKNATSKLSEDDVRAIRALAGKKSQAAISRQFGVVQSCVWNIIAKRRWQHLAD